MKEEMYADNSLSEELEVSKEDDELERENRREDLEGKKHDRQQRKAFANKLFYFMCGYLSVAMAIVAACGLNVMNLSDTVLIALISTTFADVISVFICVAKYLFSEQRIRRKQ